MGAAARFITLAALASLPASVMAAPAGAPGLYLPEWQEQNARPGEPMAPELSLLNYFFTRATYTNMVADPAGLRGVSLGPLGTDAGSFVSVDDEATAAYIEQRWIPVLSYAPHFVDGIATFRAQFEVDYTWGIGSNTLQNNQGGGINADQVNIQTKNVNVAFTPFADPRTLSIVVGTQSVYDSMYDPTVTSIYDIVRTGYKLAFFGTDATGISIYGRHDRHRGRLAWLPLGASQPQKALENDPSFEWQWIAMADYAFTVTPGTEIGLSYWLLNDDTQGEAFAYQGLVRNGPGSIQLWPFTGVRPFDIDRPTGQVHYLGVNFHHNLKFSRGPFAASGFVMYNMGRFESEAEEIKEGKLEALDIGGLAADLELVYNWGLTRDDVITLHGIYTTGDDDLGDDEYEGVFTLNYYGLPGAVFFDHKTLLLFPFTQTIGNYTGAVADIGNQGYGVTAGILSGAWDVIPNKLNLKLGAAFGRASVDPGPVADRRRVGDVFEEFTRDPGQMIGFEVNAELRWHIRYLMTVGLHAGYLVTGDYYDDHPRVTADPWAAFTTFTWYGF